MEYCKGIYCISTRELIDGGIMTYGAYKKAATRKNINVVQRGGGATGSYALVAVESLKPEQRLKVEKPRSIAPLRQVRLTPEDKIALTPCV